MKKKRGLIYFLLVCFLLFLTSCGIQKNKVELARGDVDISQYSTDAFQIGYDTQTFHLGGSRISTAGPTGLYFMENDFLYYYDYISLQTYIVCSRANCKHNNYENCDAAFMLPEYYHDRIEYYDGSLYMLGYEASSKAVNLYQISEDGSTRKTVQTLFSLNDPNDLGLFVIHRGLIFYTMYEDWEHISLFKVDMNDGFKTEKIHTLEGRGYITAIYGYNDSLYFQDWTVDRETEKDGTTLYCYDFYKETTERVILPREQMNFEIAGDTLCYLPLEAPDLLCLYDLKTGDEKKISLDYESWYVSYDGNYLYTTNWKFGEEITDIDALVVDVFSLDGEHVDTIPIPNSEFVAFGDCNTLLVSFLERTDGDTYYLKRYDKKKIGTGDYSLDILYQRGMNAMPEDGVIVVFGE